MKNLYLIRHGLAEHNALFKNFGKRIFYDKRYYDTKLIGEGKDQALLLNKTWADLEKIDIVFCSSLTRTLETAELIFKGTNVPIYALDILKEFPQGVQTCNKRSNKDVLEKQFPTIIFSMVKTNEDCMWRPDSLESISELNDRIAISKYILKCRPENNIAIIGHNSFIGQFKDNKIPLIENGDDELKHCYPYIMKSIINKPYFINK